MVQYGDFSKGKLKMEEEDWRTRDESYKIGDGELPSSDSFCKGRQKKIGLYNEATDSR